MDFRSILSNIAIRHLSDRQFQALRTSYLSLSKRLAPIQMLVLGSFDTEALRAHLADRLDSEFEILMVHSSVNRLKPMYSGNPLELLRMLIDLCGPHRTLAMPAFYFGDPAIGSLAETLAKHPRFDLKRTPSQMGLLTELFRRSKGVVQSRHPAYRVAALGPLAVQLTAGHEHATGPAGLGSPFEFMANRKTLVLGIGKSFDVMTQVHHVEGAMGESFPVPALPEERRRPLTVTVVDGAEEVTMKLRGQGLLWRFNISKLPSLLPKDQLLCWRFHGVPFFLADAGQVTRTLMEAAREGRTLYDPP